MLRESEFAEFLRKEQTIRSEKAVASRMSKARKASEILGRNLDEVTADDDLMYDSLLILKYCEPTSHAPFQNALRKYYKMCRGREFPQLRNYGRLK